MLTPPTSLTSPYSTPHLKCLVILFFFLLISACGDDERRHSNRPDQPDTEEQKQNEKEKACETTCTHVYDTCELAFPQSDGSTASHETCIDACITQDFFRGNESCVAAASCDFAEIVECIRREPAPTPDPDPDPPTTDCAEANTAWSADWQKLEDDVLIEVNRVRAAGARCGNTDFSPAPPVKMDTALRCAARLYSQDMAIRDFFDHTSPEGTEPLDRIIAAEYTGSYPIGENIAAGQPTAAAVMDSWMNSPGHCTNIMNPEFLELGTGYYYATSQPYKHFWTQNFGGGRP